MKKFIALIIAVKQRLSFSQWLLALSIFITVVLMIVFMAKIHQLKQDSKTLMLSQFSQVNQNLKNLSNQLDEKPVPSPQQINTIKQQLDSIQQYLPKLNESDEIKQLQQLISTNNKVILEKISSMQPPSRLFNKKTLENHYMPANRLPFKVSSIDVWNDLPEVTIYADEGYRLMGLDEMYHGWTLTQVSFDPAYAVFQNSQKNQVKVRF